MKLKKISGFRFWFDRIPWLLLDCARSTFYSPFSLVKAECHCCWTICSYSHVYPFSLNSNSFSFFFHPFCITGFSLGGSIMINNSIPCCFLLFLCDFLNNSSGLFLNFCSLFRFHVKDVASSSCKKSNWSELENVYLLILVLRTFYKIFLNFE